MTSMKMSDTRSARSGTAAEPAYFVSSCNLGPAAWELDCSKVLHHSHR